MQLKASDRQLSNPSVRLWWFSTFVTSFNHYQIVKPVIGWRSQSTNLLILSDSLLFTFIYFFVYSSWSLYVLYIQPILFSLRAWRRGQSTHLFRSLKYRGVFSFPVREAHRDHTATGGACCGNFSTASTE